MLIASSRHSAEDLARWTEYERQDAAVAALRAHQQRAAQALSDLRAFAAKGPCYAGTSWGKDSTVLAHMIATCGVRVPLVWIRIEPIKNPDCTLVRDAFLRAHDVDYHEIESWCTRDAGGWHASGTLEWGFARARERWGARHISGVRADESGLRTMRMRKHGIASANTCAPLGWWMASGVYAYLFAHDLPVHPAYACSQGGLWNRDRLRVASIGGKRGDGHGRTEWECHYYGDALP